MKKLFLLSCLISFGFAQDIETLIESAYKNNYNLKAMNKEVEISKQSTTISDEWDNPILSFGLSDLQLDDISDRKREAMQTQFVAFSQKIPLNNKKELSKEIAIKKENLSSLLIDIQKAKIASFITMLSYKTIIQDRYLDLIDKRVSNLKKMKRLTKAYQSDAEQSLYIELEMLKLENKRENIKEKKESLLHKIERFTISKVSNIDAKLEFENLPNIDISNHPQIKFMKSQIRVAHEEIKLKQAQRFSDIKVSGGYYQRDSRDDYINLSFSMPINIGKSEDVEVLKSKLKYQQLQQRLYDLKNSFENEIKIIKQKMSKAKNNYNRYKNYLLPKQKKITKLIEQKSRLDKAKLTDVLKSKNSVLSLKELALKELEEYFVFYGKLRYYR